MHTNFLAPHNRLHKPMTYARYEGKSDLAGACFIYYAVGCISASWLQHWVWNNHRDNFLPFLIVWSAMAGRTIWECFEQKTEEDIRPAIISTLVTAVLYCNVPYHSGLLLLITLNVSAWLLMFLAGTSKAKLGCSLIPFFLAILFNTVMHGYRTKTAQKNIQ